MRFLSCFLLMVGCTFCVQREVATTEELIKFTLDGSNKLMQEYQFKNYTVKIIYKPQDLFISRELKSIKDIKDEMKAEIKQKYQQNLYFSLSFSAGGQIEAAHAIANTARDYSALINRLAFNMTDFVFITPEDNKKDTIRALDYVYNSSLGMSAGNSLLFIFDKEKVFGKAESFTLHIRDITEKEPDAEAVFSIKDINKIPELKY